MEKQKKSSLTLLKYVYDKLNFREEGVTEIDFDDLKNKLMDIIKIEKSNNIYKQKLEKKISARERDIKELRTENEALKNEMKTYLIGRMKILHCPDGVLEGVKGEKVTGTLFMLKKEIEKKLYNEFRIELMNEGKEPERVDYKPYKIKEVKNGN
ncbi:hypothetical protein DRQ09_02480 [candidate division KSB1 bacterium]|nr:MAG: hypothetical protein DRQ09_02480 [candidate division KSB1 bacterium]